MDNNARTDGAFLGRFLATVRTALGLWRHSRAAARAAGRTYENARSAGAPHGIAAEAAFQILTKEERPALPEVVPERQSTPASRPHDDRNAVIVPGT